MRDGLSGLYRLQKDDAERAAEMLGRAFYDDPLALAAFADKGRSEETLTYYFLSPVKCCLKYGEAYAPSAEIEGAALWMPSNKLPLNFWRMLRATSLWYMFKVMRLMGRKGLSGMAHIGEHIERERKRLAPFDHIYLLALGVDPGQQGKGYARTLLQPKMERLDKEGMPCYLETLSEKNVGLYEHFGLRLLESSAIPGTDITSWAMLREPG